MHTVLLHRKRECGKSGGTDVGISSTEKVEATTIADVETLCCRFVMEEATSKFEVAIGDSAIMWLSPTDEFGGGGRVKGGAPNNGMSCCRRSVRWAWSSVVHII
jgi:hypothetical protein